MFFLGTMLVIEAKPLLLKQELSDFYFFNLASGTPSHMEGEKAKVEIPLTFSGLSYARNHHEGPFVFYQHLHYE